MFIRAVGGHSKSSTIAHAPNAEVLQPADVHHLPPVLAHVSVFRNAFSSAREGLIPGGPQGSREHVRFMPLHVLAHSPQHVRHNGDLVLLFFTADLDTNDIPLYLTKNYYAVTDLTVLAWDARNMREVNHQIFPIHMPEDFATQ